LEYLQISLENFRNTAAYGAGAPWGCMDDHKGGKSATCNINSYWSYVMKGLYISDYYWLSGVDSFSEAQGFWEGSKIIG